MTKQQAETWQQLIARMLDKMDEAVDALEKEITK